MPRILQQKSPSNILPVVVSILTRKRLDFSARCITCFTSACCHQTYTKAIHLIALSVCTFLNCIANNATGHGLLVAR